MEEKDPTVDSLIQEYNQASLAQQSIRDNSEFPWLDREMLLSGILPNQNTKNPYKSRIKAGELNNLVLDKACRVMAQTPTGSVLAMSTKDSAIAAAYEALLEKYIFRKANSQFPFETKLKMWVAYSEVYGTMPMYITHVNKPDYKGPDMFLLNPRSMKLSPGAVSIYDASYVFVDSWVTVAQIEAWKKSDEELEQKVDKLKAQDPEKAKKYKPHRKNLDVLLSKIKESKDSGSSQTKPTDEQTWEEQQQNQNISASGRHQKVKIITKYCHDEWIEFSPEYQVEIRRSKNGNCNGKLPIADLYTFPLMDRYTGLGMYERGYSIEYALSSNLNLYMDSAKYNMMPPLMVDFTKVDPNTLVLKPGAIWDVQDKNAVQPLFSSPTNLTAFQSTHSVLKAQMMNMGATTDTSVAKEVDPGMGKTPQAIQQQMQREGARDNWSRKNFEQAFEEIVNQFIDIIAHVMPEEVVVEVSADELKKFEELGYETTLYSSKKRGEVKIKKSNLYGEDGKLLPVYYSVDTGSSLRKDDQAQNATFKELFAMATDTQVQEAMQQSGKKFDIAFLVKKIVQTSGAEDTEKVLIEDIQETEVDPDQQDIQEEMYPDQAMMNQLPQIPDQAAMQPMNQPPQLY